MPGAERHLPAEQAEPSAQQRIRGPGLRPGQQRASRIGRAGRVLGVRRREQPLRPAGRIDGQLGRTLEEGRRRGQAPARLRPARGPLELRSHVLVRV